MADDTPTAAHLDRDSPMPLWAQLEADLRRRLEAGEFNEGFFPTDHDLTEAYQVSRHTVREAVRHLNKTGLLKRERGRGTVVNRAEFEQSLGTLYSLFQSVESAGVEQTSDVLQLEIVTDSVAASHLGLPEDAELVLLARLRKAGAQALAVDLAPPGDRRPVARGRLDPHRALPRAGQAGLSRPQSRMGAVDADRADSGRSQSARSPKGRRRLLPRAARHPRR